MMPDVVEAMLSGPGRVRFILQPLVALMLGLRDGRADSAAGRPPYLYALVFASGVRRDEVATALRALTKPFAVSIILDVVLQSVIFDTVRLWQALAVGTALIALPYVVARGLTGRYLRRRSRLLRTEPPVSTMER